MRLKTLVIAAVIVGAGIGGTLGLPTPAAARQSSENTFELDPVHSMVVFRIKHMGVAYVYGSFWEPTGSYSLDAHNTTNSFVKIELDASKVDTGNDRRNGHLRSPDFFNAKQYPKITFESTSITTGEGDGMEIKGNVTMVGQTKPVTARLRYIGEGDTPQGYKSGFEAEFVIKRSEWGMTKFLEHDSLGDEVSLFVTVEGLRK